MRDQIESGLALADRVMERRSLMVCGDRGLHDSLTGLMRRVLQDAVSKFAEADVSHIHNIGYIDLTKFGRLTMPEIDSCANWTYRLLNLNPDYSTQSSYINVFCCKMGFWKMGFARNL